MKMRLGDLRRIIRRIVTEGPAGPGVSADPTDVRGFYPYDVQRGADIQGFWYRSPGRSAGAEGDPGRPSDEKEYLGMAPKKSSGAEKTTGEEETAD